jgi:hypothetical protein
VDSHDNLPSTEPVRTYEEHVGKLFLGSLQLKQALMSIHRHVRLAADRPVNSNTESLLFEASDHHGPLQLHVSTMLWARLQAEAPLPCDAEDRRDYALGMLEHCATEGSVVLGADGSRTIHLQ